jgi:thiamine biosynthesis protein ThiS
MSEKRTKVVLNGAVKEIQHPCSGLELLAMLGWKPTQVVMEHNGRVLPRSELGSVFLNENDIVEIILPVAGG